MNDYERIARTIRYLDANHAGQPDLTELASQAGLSASHFHRLFAKWAGVTPKDFLQCLTLSDVRMRLINGGSVLSSALDAGLSGPGRLHDLCVTLEGASPGEMKSGGAGWTLEAGFADTPFGIALIAEGKRGVTHLSFVEPDGKRKAWEMLQAEWPNARLVRKDVVARRLAAIIFAREGKTGCPLRAFVKATPFQLRVWQALLRVPPAHLTTYGQIADCIGQPSASRAVGTAVGSNDIAYLIPCHRVIRATGALGGYRWNPVRKQVMLAWEGAKA